MVRECFYVFCLRYNRDVSMIFIPFLLLGLSTAFFYLAHVQENSQMRSFGFILLIASLGSGFITYIALSALG